ncbi:MAG TPA: hypothetical protein VE760_05325 [Acidimicrobiales bacterium]|nr:hypothetical protein [Acidimicrobiales bacterium]
MSSRPGALDPDRRLLLSRAKLAALVRSHWGIGAFDGDPRPAMSGLVARWGERGWMLVDEDSGRALGRGLLWALRSGVRELHLLFPPDDGGAAPAARRGRLFRTRVAVWRVQGTEVSPVAAEPLSAEPPLDTRAGRYRELLATAGAEPVTEWGTLYGDVWGLEVARVERQDDDLSLGVGVTKEDRLTHRLMWGDDPDARAVRSVVEQVREIREHGDLGHPLNQLARERWLRAWLLREPGQVGARHLEPAAPPVARPDDVRVRIPAAALGSTEDGQPMLVICSVGFDSEAVPMAVELAEAVSARTERIARLVLALPARDDHQLLRLAVADAVLPVELALVPDDWPLRTRAGA